MTEIAYMIREDWGQFGSAIEAQSSVINEWLGSALGIVAVADKRCLVDDRSIDAETINHITAGGGMRTVLDVRELGPLEREGEVIDVPVTILHPIELRDMETIRRFVRSGLAARVFVLVWSRQDLIHAWLDGLGALNLHSQHSPSKPDPLLMSAAKLIQGEEYNGLSTGRGKDSVVQLVRELGANGYPIEEGLWLRAYFAVDGSFRHAETLRKLVLEIREGRRHRVRDRYRSDIVEILRRDLD